jgi:hypothetical protein
VALSAGSSEVSCFLVPLVGRRGRRRVGASRRLRAPTCHWVIWRAGDGSGRALEGVHDGAWGGAADGVADVGVTGIDGVPAAMRSSTRSTWSSIVDHHLLRVHHVRDDVASRLPWDLGFLAFGAALIAVGLACVRSGRIAFVSAVRARDVVRA